MRAFAGHGLKNSWVSLAAIFGALTCPPSHLCGQGSPPRHVVVLIPSDGSVSTSQSPLDLAMQSAPYRREVRFQTEHLGAEQTQDDRRQEESLVQFLRAKYLTQKPDVVLADGFRGLSFAQRYAGQIFGDIPVVFVSVEESRLEGMRLPRHFTGVTHLDDVRGTLEAALQLQPDTAEVVVPVGTSEFDQYWFRHDRLIFDRLASKVRFRYLAGLPMITLLRQLNHLGPHTIVFVHSLTRDGAGEDLEDYDVFGLLSRNVSAPLYGPAAGNGFVGGRPTGWDDGRFSLAIQMVGRILAGENVSNIPIQQAIPKHAYVFDAVQLRKWKMDLRRVPPGSLLLNQEPSFWELHRRLVILVSTFVAVESMLIAILLIQRARRKHAEALLTDRNRRLEQSERSLRELSGQLITAYEDERTRIARELHDDLNQQVANLGLSLSNMKRGVPAAMEKLRGELSNAQERLLSLSDGIRHVSHELHPGMLELFGLVPALRSHCAEFGIVTSLPVAFETNCDEPVPAEVALCVYRIAQESLRNTARHSRASSVRVSLTKSGERLRLVVADNGAGFDVREARSRGGLGLRSMEERVRLVHGSLDLLSRAGEGTTLSVTVDLERFQSPAADRVAAHHTR